MGRPFFHRVPFLCKSTFFLTQLTAFACLNPSRVTCCSRVCPLCWYDAAPARVLQALQHGGQPVLDAGHEWHHAADDDALVVLRGRHRAGLGRGQLRGLQLRAGVPEAMSLYVVCDGAMIEREAISKPCGRHDEAARDSVSG